MPITLTDADTFDNVSGPSGGDIRNAANVRSYLQTLANRTRHLYNRIIPLADIAALKAINTTGFVSGASRFVTGQGLFTFDSASGLAEIQPYIIQPTVGSGRWFAAHAHRTTRVLRLYPGHLVAGAVYNALVSGVTGTDTDNVFVTNQAFGNFNTGTEIDDYFTIAYGMLVCKTLPGAGTQRHVAWIELPVPDGVTITSISAYLKPSVVSALPVNMPWISAIRLQALDEGNPGYGGGVANSYLLSTRRSFDTSANTTAYNLKHAITQTPDQNNVVDRSLYGYELAVGFASGANAVLGDQLRYIDVTMTIPDARGG